MRFTIVDDNGTISFPGPGHGLKALAASCSRGADSHALLLERLADYDARWSTFVLDGLAIFDEHVSAANPRSIELWLDQPGHAAERPLRVVNAATRQASLEPARLGVVIFNLLARRIVQVQNHYCELQRSDRGRLRIDGRPVSRYYHYTLPSEWSILP